VTHVDICTDNKIVLLVQFKAVVRSYLSLTLSNWASGWDEEDRESVQNFA
jgi:hypothetical protein